MGKKRFNSSLILATFQVLKKHMCLVATALESTNTEYFHQDRKFSESSLSNEPTLYVRL